MRNPGAYRPSGSFADLTRKAKSRIKAACTRCGVPIGGRAKKYCAPCGADAYDDKLQTRRKEHSKARKRAVE